MLKDFMGLVADKFPVLNINLVALCFLGIMGIQYQEYASEVIAVLATFLVNGVVPRSTN
jgi:hypothetical protein